MRTVTDLVLYPVVSMAGKKVEELRLERDVVCGDREFLVVDGQGNLLTQSTLPQLSTFTAWHVDEFELCITSDSFESITVHPRQEGRRVDIQAWKNNYEAVDQGDDVARWLSDRLGRRVRLVFLPAYERQIPLRIVSRETFLDLLVREIEPRSIPSIDCFRPNVVVQGCDRSWEETDWYRFTCSGIPFAGVQLCHRRDVLAETFGIYAIPLASGSIGVSDTIDVERFQPLRVA